MNFTEITFADFETLKPVFERQPHTLCPYSLSSIIVWKNDIYTPYQARWENELIICARYGEGRYLLLPIAPMAQFPPERLRALAEAANLSTFWFVPEPYLETFGRDAVEACFDIEEQPIHADYVYRREDLAELKGNTYSKKRNLIHQFDREYLSQGRVTVSPVTKKDIDDCLVFLEEWCVENDCGGPHRNDLACEKEAAVVSLTHLDQTSSEGLLLRIDGKVAAFGIGDRLTQDMGVLHFEKAFSHIKGLYQYFDRECALQLFEGKAFINKESDMGEPNLAQAKRSYRPARVIMSYQLTLRK